MVTDKAIQNVLNECMTLVPGLKATFSRWGSNKRGGLIFSILVETERDDIKRWVASYPSELASSPQIRAWQTREQALQAAKDLRAKIANANQTTGPVATHG